MKTRNKLSGGRAFAVAAALVLALAPALAEARASKGFSSGNRGARTQSAPPPTATAPAPNSSFQRSAGPNQTAPATGLNRPAAAAAAPAAAAGGMFSSPLARGIMGGLIGAGIFGLLSGSGLFSGLSGLAGIFGFIMQMALIGGIVWLGMAWWRRRQQTAGAMAGADSTYARTSDIPPVGGNAAQQAPEQTSAPRSMLGGLGGGLGGLGGAAASSAGTGSSGFGEQTRPIKLDGADFEAFEKLLAEIQQAYANEDLPYLRRIATEEMAGYFESDIADQQARGLQAKSGNVKLLQGDLSEAWAENSGEYATVAMRFEMIDALVDEAGKVVEGDLVNAQEITEVWTFVRGHDVGPKGWILSAIQQV
jgi:predicted lipid-binding transport protein (Tim44 family)